MHMMCSYNIYMFDIVHVHERCTKFYYTRRMVRMGILFYTIIIIINV